MDLERILRPARALLPLLALVAFVACGPENRRGDVTPTALIATVTPTPTETPSFTPVRQLSFVRVVGTAGTPFTGQLSDGSGSRSVDGVVPEDFVIGTALNFISATFSKTEEGLQTITAQVFVEGALVAEQSTTTNFGTVTVNAAVP